MELNEGGLWRDTKSWAGLKRGWREGYHAHESAVGSGEGFLTLKSGGLHRMCSSMLPVVGGVDEIQHYQSVCDYFFLLLLLQNSPEVTF